MCDCHRGLFLRRHASRTEASRNVPLWIVTKRLRADNITKLLTERLPIESIEIGLLLRFLGLCLHKGWMRNWLFLCHHKGNDKQKR